MKSIKDLKEMIKEPASKEWFEKHSKSKALKTYRDKDSQRTEHNPSALSHKEQEAKKASNKAGNPELARVSASLRSHNRMKRY